MGLNKAIYPYRESKARHPVHSQLLHWSKLNIWNKSIPSHPNYLWTVLILSSNLYPHLYLPSDLLLSFPNQNFMHIFYISDACHIPIFLIILNGTRKSHLTYGLAYFYTQRKMLVSLTHTPCIKLWAYIKNYYKHFYFVSVDWKSIKPATQIYYRNYTRAFKFNMVAFLLYL